MAFVYMCCGICNGIVFGQMYRSFGGDRFFRSAAFNAVFFPMVLMIILTIIEVCDWFEKSVYVVPFSFVSKVVLVWNLINSMVVFISSSIAFKASKSQQARVNRISKEMPVPETFSAASMPVTVVTGSFLCFLAIGVEFFYLLTSIWHEEYYKMYMFLAIQFLVLTVTSMLVSIIQTYTMLCNGIWEWHWRAFNVGAATCVYMFMISVYLYIWVDGTMNFATSLIYLFTIAIVCCSFALMNGFVSFLASYAFVNWLYNDKENKSDENNPKDAVELT